MGTFTDEELERFVTLGHINDDVWALARELLEARQRIAALTEQGAGEPFGYIKPFAAEALPAADPSSALAGCVVQNRMDDEYSVPLYRHLAAQGAGEAEPLLEQSACEADFERWATHDLRRRDDSPQIKAAWMAAAYIYWVAGRRSARRPPASASAELSELLAAARNLCEYGHGDTEMRDRLRRAGKAYDALNNPAKETP